MADSPPIDMPDLINLSDLKPSVLVPGNPTYQQTMLRVRDAEQSLKFYRDTLGMTLIDSFDFPQYKFSLYFLTTMPAGEEYSLTPGTKEAHDFLWTYPGVTLELTHNHGTESDKEFKGYHPGNEEKDGFGHLAVNVNDVYATSEKLEAAGIPFKKKPDEGRMKGLAFAKDPDGYWLEIVERGETAKEKIANEMNFSQTMMRIKDPKKSLPFYMGLGMKLLEERHYDDFSLYFLGSSNVDESISRKDQFQPVLELTHNHGTENDLNFKHYNGNEEGRQGFGHIGFLVDDVYEACDAIRSMGYGFKKEPDGGSMKGTSLTGTVSTKHCRMYTNGLRLSTAQINSFLRLKVSHLPTIQMATVWRSSSAVALSMATSR